MCQNQIEGRVSWTKQSSKRPHLTFQFVPMVAFVLIILVWGDVPSRFLSNIDSIHVIWELSPRNDLNSGWRNINGFECPGSVGSTERDAVHSYNALQVNSQNVRALVNAGRFAWMSGRCDLARTKWEVAVKSQPSDVTVWFYLGLAEYATGDKELAVQSFRNAGAGSHLLSLGSRAIREGQSRQALKWFDLAAATRPDLQSISYLAGQYVRLGQPSDAEAAWRRLAALTSPDSPDHWRAVGEAAYLSGEWGAAADAYQRGAALARDPYGFLLSQGQALERMGDLSLAAEVYKSAVSTHPTEIWAYVSLGDLERQQQHYSAALAWLRKAEAIDPASATPKFYLGKTYLEERCYDEAEYYLLAAWSLAPQDRYAPYFLAQSKHEQGDVSTAIAYLNQALTLDNGVRWDWHILLGDWYVETGDKGNAITAYRKALSLNPNSTDAIRKLEQLVP